MSNELRFKNHLTLTQKLLTICRSKKSFDSIEHNFIKSYIDTLPVDDLTTLVYWDQATLAEVDSELIRKHYTATNQFYRYIYELLFNHNDSPY